MPAGTFAGLRWEGLGRLNGEPCAVLRRDDDPTSTVGPTTVSPATLLSVALTASRLAGPPPPDPRWGPLLDGMRRSEHALLGGLDAVTRELRAQRQARHGPRTVRAVLGRSRSGRAVIRAVRRIVV
jgi:hypothetical protein